MKTSEIRVGVTYKNRGEGTTRRTVLAIGDEHRPESWLGGDSSAPPKLRYRPDEPGVLFSQNGKTRTLYLSTFAKWAGGPAEARDDG
mgnify:CR=1 FL=1